MAELHAHTSASDGVPSPEELVRRADRLGLDVLAVTDHDLIDGALRARDYARRSGARVEVIVGIEVTTRRQDHIVGLFVEAPVPIFRPVIDTVRAIQAQGGLAIVAHPFLGLPSSISPQRLAAALRHASFDGIEVENQYMRERTRAAVRAFLTRQPVGASIGASDAHFGDLARAVTLFPGRSAGDLRAALVARTVVAARGALRHPPPSPADHARNQFRSLLKLPVLRVRQVLRQR
ncbi:MAG: PHP domain-containing protein [Actinobacteria bacterium]|nr:PHP domain-containing protein [Actinomycetota bacterium]